MDYENLINTVNEIETWNIILLILVVLVGVGAMVAIFLYRHHTKRTLQNLNQMLDAAIQGSFDETIFDESLQSAVETRMAHYLSASQVSAHNLAEEKNRIKELVADISHQTKTPIANILLYGQLLEEKGLPEETLLCINALNAQTAKLSFLIDSLVKISRLETGILTFHPKNAEIQSVLEQVYEQILPKAKNKGTTLFLESTQERAVFDPKWIHEAIYNIVDNAVKYTPSGGTVSICTIAYDLFCHIDISDTGIGISEEEQSKIFGRFYRSPKVSDAEGVGIGLYLARQIVSGQGGYIKVSSQLGNGATFSVFLPREA